MIKAFRELQKAGVAVVTFLKPFLTQLLSRGGILLITTASEAVRTVATTMEGQSGTAKRKAAYAMIESTIKAQGAELAAEVINAAIETAVVQLKAGKSSQVRR